MREARAEVYREQEETRRQWLTDQAGQVASARERTAQTIHAAKEQMAAEILAARQSLSEAAGSLADQIATAVLARRA